MNQYIEDKTELKDWVVIMDPVGTLIDSDNSNFELIKEMFNELGYDDDKINTMMTKIASGADYDELVRFLQLDENTHRLLASKMISKATSNNVSLLPYVNNALQWFLENDMNLSLVTDNYLEVAVNTLRNTNIMSFFNKELIFASDNFPYRKPSQEIAHAIFNSTKCTKGIIIGNSEKDTIFAKNCHLPLILIRPKHNPGLEDANTYHRLKYKEVNYQSIYKLEDWNQVQSVIKTITGWD